MFYFHEDASKRVLIEPIVNKFRDLTRFWIQRVAVPVIMVIGLFGNLVTIIIMTRRRMRSTTNMYLAALAFVDMLYLILTFTLGLSHYPNMASKRYYLYWLMKPYIMMLTDACSNTSVWLTVTFTIERFIAVRYPMKGMVWCTEARAKRLIVVVFAFGVICASPVPFEWVVTEKQVNLRPRIVQADNSSQNSTQYSTAITSNDATTSADLEIDDHDVIISLEYSDFGRNETYKTIYYWSTAVIFYFVPLFFLMLFNGFLIKSVHQSRKERSKLVNRRSVDHPSESTVPRRNYTKAQNISPTINDSRTPRHFNVNLKTPELIHTRETISDKGNSDVTTTDDGPISDQLNPHSSQASNCGVDDLPLPSIGSTDFATSTISQKFRNRISSLRFLKPPSGRQCQDTSQIISVAPVSSSSSQESRITIMLIAVVILFLFCQIPSAAMLLYTSVRDVTPNTTEHALILALGNIFNFLMAVNAAGNFILYSFLSKKYRRTFVILFCECLRSGLNQEKLNQNQQRNFNRMAVGSRLGDTLKSSTVVNSISYKEQSHSKGDTLV